MKKSFSICFFEHIFSTVLIWRTFWTETEAQAIDRIKMLYKNSQIIDVISSASGESVDD